MNRREQGEKQRQARRRASAQRSRAGFLRGRVVAASILCFGLLWALVFMQMATGNDPVLSAKAQATAAKRQGRRDRSKRTEAVTEPAPEPEPEALEPETVDPEVGEEPEPELEPLTTGQS